MRSPLRFDVESNLRDNLLYQRRETFGARNREIREDFAIHFDAFSCEGVHEFRISCSVQASRSIDTLDPERTEFSLTDFAVAVREHHTAIVLFTSVDVRAGTCAVVTFGAV